MKRPGSIRLKLISLYAGLLSCAFLCFGGYIYLSFQRFLIQSLQEALLRRAEQIAGTILDKLPEKGASYVANEIQARYLPELNERVIRIVDRAGKVIYASRNAEAVSQRTAWVDSAQGASPISYWRLNSGLNGPIDGVSVRHPLPDGSIDIVEVAAPDTEINSALHNLLLTMAIGFPALIVLAVFAGYSLLGRALRPVDQIVGAAERITFKHLNQRLPVPQTGDEFERISEALNRMIERLSESFQIANRFSADASHELRTPLTIIQGELEVFINEPSLSSEAAERAADILEEVVRLSRIVEGLLLVSRLEAGEAQMRREILDLGELVKSVAEQMELLGRDKLLSLTCDTTSGILIEGDGLRIQQAVVNILDNAIKYTPEGGTIILTVAETENRAVVEVIDSGMGISPRALPNVFKRFFRAEEAKAGRTQGSGLGLAIVHSIVEAHGGHVHIESRDAHGTKVRIDLPLLSKVATKFGGETKLVV